MRASGMPSSSSNLEVWACLRIALSGPQGTQGFIIIIICHGQGLPEMLIGFLFGFGKSEIRTDFFTNTCTKTWANFLWIPCGFVPTYITRRKHTEKKNARYSPEIRSRIRKFWPENDPRVPECGPKISIKIRSGRSGRWYMVVQKHEYGVEFSIHTSACLQ